MTIGMEESYHSVEGPPYQRSMIPVSDDAYITSFSTEESTGSEECDEDSESGRSCSLSGNSPELYKPAYKSLSTFTNDGGDGYYLANSRTNGEGEAINPLTHVGPG